jgi:hypothetical protein
MFLRRNGVRKLNCKDDSLRWPMALMPSQLSPMNKQESKA